MPHSYQNKILYTKITVTIIWLRYEQVGCKRKMIFLGIQSFSSILYQLNLFFTMARTYILIIRKISVLV